MLQTALEYKDIFPRLKIREKNYSCVPTESDWDMAKKITEKLQIFFFATKLFSVRKYPTANVFFISMCQLRKALMDWIVSPDQIISDMAVKIFEKFDKYWSVVYVVLTLAVILDPRYKMKVVEFYYPLIYGLNSPIHVEQVRKICYDLLEEYQSKHFKSKQSQASSSQTPFLGSSSQGSHDQGMSELVAFLNSSISVHVNFELDHYLEESVLHWTQEFDILNWWKTNGLKYPTLQMIARDFLVVPVTTVASESAFSTSGRIVSVHRSRLHEDMLEALMCSQNWLWSNFEDSSNLNLQCITEEEIDC